MTISIDAGALDLTRFVRTAELKIQPLPERGRRLVAIAPPDFGEPPDRAGHEITQRRF